MPTPNAITAAAILAALACAGAAAAQPPYTAPGQQNYRPQPQPSQWEQDYGRGQFNPPEGSYRQSCRNIDFRNQVLRATCTNRAGQAVNSSIDPRTCQDRDIYNENGTLRCGARLPAAQLPSGSYRTTCNTPAVRDNVLTATCATRQGRYVAARLDLRTCRANAEVFNDNGMLRCAAPVADNRPLPTGSYRSTCNTAAVRDNILTANCATTQNRYVPARLDLRQCRPNAEVYNDNGILGCDQRGGRGPGRDEAFEAVVYTDANYRGRQLLVTSANADLTRVGFNDRIRSIRVLRGRTQVCVDVQYRGRCEILNQSVADLRSIRMDNVISSIRGEDNGGGRGRGRGNGRDERND